MAKSEVVASLDVGSGQLVCAVGRRHPDQDELEIIGATCQPCRGVKGGVVINIDETALGIGRAVEACEEMAKETIRDLVIGVRGAHLQTFNHHGAINIARTDKEITPDDVEQVIESTKAVPISTDREIIHVIPQDFVLDRQQGVPNPIGMEGSLLEVEVHIVTAGTSHLNNVWRSINNAGFAIREPVYGLLGVGDVVVTQEERDLGCLLVDLGGATTGLAIYADGGVRFTKEIPVGADAVTNDLAHGLRTSFSQAKMVKERFGSAVRSTRKKVAVASSGQEEESKGSDDEVSYTSVDGRTQKQIQRSTLFDFIAPRVEEIFTMVQSEVENSGWADRIVAGGAILTGGGSMMPGMIQASEKILELPTRKGLPQNVLGPTDIVAHPTYATAVGLLSFHFKGEGSASPRAGRRPVGSLFGQIKNLFGELF